MKKPDANPLLALAEAAPTTSNERVTSLAAAASDATEHRLILVGGAAVNLYTGTYNPTDIDMVGDLPAPSVLRSLGFVKRGRHWEYTFTDGEVLAIELVASELFELAIDPVTRIRVGESSLLVISLDDLMMDRLLQATGGEPVTFADAVRLAVAVYERLDWRALSTRTVAAAVSPKEAYRLLPDVLDRVRRAARREIRAAKRSETLPSN